MNTPLREVTKILKSCIVAEKGGVPISNINSEFSYYTGYDIPYLALGYHSLHDMMRNIKEITTSRNKFGEVVYVVKDDKKIRHIAEMVKNQKDSSYRSQKNRQERVLASRREKNRKDVISNRNRSRQSTINSSRRSFLSEENFSFESYEDNHNVTVHNVPPKNQSTIHEPLIDGQQLIGDDFFLQLAIRNLSLPVWRLGTKSPLHCGLCVSGMTIRSCINKLRTVKSLSNKIVIMLGAEDIYRGRTFEQMVDDFEELLFILHERFAFSENAIKICTIPPLANLGIYSHVSKIIALRSFNNYLRRRGMTGGYSFTDFFLNMTNANCQIQWDLFQINARMVSGSAHPYVLFNNNGRRLALNLILASHIDDYY